MRKRLRWKGNDKVESGFSRLKKTTVRYEIIALVPKPSSFVLTATQATAWSETAARRVASTWALYFRSGSIVKETRGPLAGDVLRETLWTWKHPGRARWHQPKDNRPKTGRTRAR